MVSAKDKGSQGDYFSPWDIVLPKEGDDEPDVGPGLGGDGAVKPKFPGGGGGPGIKPKDNKGPMGPMGDPGGLGVGGVVGNWDRDALVRFIDPDVKEGKRYQYEIWITLANPNHGKKDKVAFAQLAESPVLVSKSEFTPSIAIPYENFL